MIKKENIFKDFNIRFFKCVFISYKIKVNTIHISILFSLFGIILIVLGFVFLANNKYLKEIKLDYPRNC